MEDSVIEKKLALVSNLLEGNGNLSPQLEEGINSLNKRFPQFEQSTNKIFCEIKTIVENDPQFVIDFFKSSLIQDKGIETLIAKFDHIKLHNNDLTSQMSFIAEIWDLSSLFKIHAFLLSRKNTSSLSIEDLNQPDQIFKYFQDLGVSKSDKNKLRKIRNCFKHQFSIKDGVLLGDKGEMIMNVEDVEGLYLKLRSFVIWSKIVLGLSLVRYLKILMLLIVSIISLQDANDDKLDRRIQDLKKYFPKFFNSILSKSKNKKNRKIKKPNIKRKLKVIENLKYWALIFMLKLLSKSSPRLYNEITRTNIQLRTQLLNIYINKVFNIVPELEKVKIKLTNKSDVEAIEDIIQMGKKDLEKIHNVILDWEKELKQTFPHV